MVRRGIVIAVLLALSARADEPKPVDVPGFWTDAELALIDKGLDAVNCTRKDLGFQKRPIDDPFRLAVVNRALDDPLSVGTVAAMWDKNVRRGDLPILGRIASAHLYEKSPHGPAILRDDDWMHRDGWRAQFEGAARAFEASPLTQVLERLGPRAPRILDKAYATQVESFPGDLDDETFRAAMLEFGRESMVVALGWFLEVVRSLVMSVRGSPDLDRSWKGVERIGSVVIAGYGDDVHDEGDDVAIVLDLGGNDTWLHGARSRLGEGPPIHLCIDIEGNDRYVGGNDLSFGAALGGVAVQWDVAGDDVYEAGHASLGAGILGVGVLVDEAGNDTYRCKDFGCGAGAFGVGILLDTKGNDLYHVDLFGQGFASTWGCGVLADLEGNDSYDAGGVHLHAPLFRDRFQSLSQGFSIGMRPDASGGVGVLVDVKGNDRYACDIYGQGAAYWYALGLLIDDDGNDTYVLGQYGQGSGIHLAAGMLLDRAGEDLYYDMNGVGQGGAHDYSVGFLVDRGGDDHYSGSGGTQGGALTNSVAILLDGGGNDGYTAVRIGGAQGSATAARNTGGIGLLLDAGGRDLYSELTRDGTTWTKDWIGAGIDEPSPPEPPAADPQAPRMTKEEAVAKVEAEGRKPGPDGAPAWDLDALWKLASQWEVGDNRVMVPVARERLVALGKPALDRAIDRLGTKDGLEYRAVETTLKEFPAADVVPRLLERSREDDMRVRKGAVKMLGSLQAAEAYDRLVEMLAQDDVRANVLDALGVLGKAPADVPRWLRSPKEFDGVAAAACLGAIADEPSIAALVGALDPAVAFPVRIAAEQQLVALGEKALPAIEKALEAHLPRPVLRSLVRVLERSKAPGAAALRERFPAAPPASENPSAK